MRHFPDHAILFPLAPIAACVALAWPGSAGAAEWTVTPGVDLRETYTDNIRLSPAGSEQSDFITEVAPRLSIRGIGARMKLSADYGMRNFFYARTDGASNTQHYLQANANAELVENLFFIDGRASSGQQAISEFGPQVSGNGNLSGNETEVRSASISPYLRHRFGRAATGELRYSRDMVNADAGGLRDSNSDRVRLSIDSGSDFHTLQWGVLYDDQRIEYKDAEDVDTRALSGTLRYLVTPRISLTATAGREENSYASIGRNPEGSFWSLGAIWAPSERTHISAAAGKRFFGDTLSIDARHRTRMGIWSIGYQEDITTARSQFLVPVTQDTASFLSGLWEASIPDQAAREQLVQEFIRDASLPSTMVFPVTAYTNRVFLQKTAHASVAFRGAFNTLILNLFRTQREPQSASAADASLGVGIGALAGEATRQTGAGAVWNWRLSPRTSVVASAGINRIHGQASGREDDNISARIGITRQLQQKVKGGVELRRLEKRSNQVNAEYRENAVTAFLQISF
ncbi:TIGR03016 family PEP-CTERM system-associated outer membrane protein [Noviherbaspirillum sp.]|uniref:TIGR03016 family PEP-CTERM system-associated outer membrane protein n=1 Tax=Noviherbaspirillum sp. TaxID=1926288 RepID=UPI002D2EEEA1|nr:TIGR03016 family PEP-CTERM system-associated outer membrane protein [Noviherbaspirillum sp.]HZW21713.1 TIGR03016 family PEP-CTERM system-associated outer membrane protein [Noviherbaspirillum sp.]